MPWALQYSISDSLESIVHLSFLHAAMIFRSGASAFDPQFKTDLVITLSGSAVADSGSTFLAGDFHQLLGNKGPCHGGSQKIFVFIYGCGLYTGHYIFITEFIDNIQDIKLGGAAEFCSFFQAVQFFRLSAVDADYILPHNQSSLSARE